MGLDIEVKVSLEEHREHSVIVSVLLSPKEGPTAVDGVALRLRDVRGEGLGPRVLLPIAGTLAQAMRTTVALAPEADDGVPPGANVQVVAWRGEEQCEAVLPTDPMTALEMHARGTSIWPVTEPTQLLEPLSAADRARWVALYPWLDEPRLPPPDQAALEVVDHEPTTEQEVEAFAEDLGLDAESAEWLKDLLDE